MLKNITDWKTTLPAVAYFLGVLGLSVWANHDPKDAPDIYKAIAGIAGLAAVHLGIGARSGDASN